MSKKLRTIVKIFMWGALYTLPILHFLIGLKGTPTLTFLKVMTTYVLEDNFISATLIKIFGTNGQFPLFSITQGVIHYFSYIVIITFLHICTDIMLFLPECGRYIFDKMTGVKDEDSL